MKYLFQNSRQKISDTIQCSVLAVPILFTACADASAADILRPELSRNILFLHAEVKSRGVVVYEIPVSAGSDFQSRLDWDWITRRTTSECKKGGFGLPTGETIVLALTTGSYQLIDLCEKHDADWIAGIKSIG